jgi:hypothetical protein
MTDADIYLCWQKHDAKHIGKRGGEKPPESAAVEAAAEELKLPYSRVRDVVLARLFTRFGG